MRPEEPETKTEGTTNKAGRTSSAPSAAAPQDRKSARKEKGRWGRRKSLIRLNSAKEIEGFEFGFRSAGFGICSIRLGFRSEKFGFPSGGFGFPSPLLVRTWPYAKPPRPSTSLRRLSRARRVNADTT